MLSFKVHRLEIGGWHYLLLPKLASTQMRIFERRLANRGYLTSLSGVITARSSMGSVRIDPAGVCRSTVDPSDDILPVVPDVLASSKERISLQKLKLLYCRLGTSKGKVTVRVETRVESFSLWDELRALGACGLAPDEHAVASFLLSRGRDCCRMLTDFPADGSAVQVCGRRRYFDSRIECPQAAETLRQIGMNASRNSYIQRGGVVEFGAFTIPSAQDWVNLFENLGEWCGLSPV